MWSSRPVCARPVRTLARSCFNVSTDFCIFCSADFLTSLIIVPPRSTMHERALVSARYHALQRTRNEDREHLEQHFLVAAQRERGSVHHLQVLDDRLVEGQRR